MKSNIYTQILGKAGKRVDGTILLAMVAIISLVTGFSSFGQNISTYNFAQTSSTYKQVGLGTSLTTSGTYDDAAFAVLALPFTFTYHAVAQTQIVVDPNGNARFGATGYTSYTGVSSSTDILSPFGGDDYGNTANGGNVSYATVGATPNRVFTIQWTNWGFFSSGLNEASFQIKLYETTNKVQFVYGAAPGTGAKSMQVGLNGSTSTDFQNRTTTTNWAATTAGTVNTATCTVSATVRPVSGLTFTWSQANSVAAMAFAQTSTIYLPIEGTSLYSVANAVSACQDDAGWAAGTIPFTFSYHGAAFTTVGMGPNGYAQLGVSSPTLGYSAICSNANVLSPLNADLYGCPAVNGEVSYSTLGTTPNRIFVMQWSNWGIYSSGLYEFSFQIRLFETTNAVQFMYGPQPGTSARTAYCGLTGATTADFQTRTTTTNWAATTNAGSVCTSSTVSSTVRPTNGLTFTWTIPANTPIISSFSPTTGCPGATVVITGNLFTGATAVKVGGTNVTSFVVNSATQITAVVASGTTGVISVTNANGTGSGTGTFTFTSAPTITSVVANPSSVCNNGSTTLTANIQPVVVNAATYAFSQAISPASLVNIEGTGTLVGSGGQDDGNWGPYTIPFNFNYLGTNYTSIGLSDNCYATLGAAPTTSYAPLSALTKCISAMGADMYGLVSNHRLEYATTGTSPNRVFRIQWSHWGKYSSGLDEVTVQIALFETSNVIMIGYIAAPGTTVFTCNAGINGNAVTDFNDRTSTTNWSASTAGPLNTSTMSFGGGINPVTGLCYIFTPPAQPSYTYLWAVTSGPGTLSSTTTNPTTGNSISANTTYRVSVSNGSCASTATVTVTTGASLSTAPTTTLPPPPTPGASNATSTADDEIFNVTFGSLNNTSTCATLAPGPGSIVAEYSNYTSGIGAPAIPTITAGVSTPLSVTIGYCLTSAYTTSFSVFIDLNNDGDFADAGEVVYTVSGVVAALGGTAYPTNITIPTSAYNGQHRMRVVDIEGTYNPTPSTGTYTWGETEDYLINITGGTPAPVACGGSAVYYFAPNASGGGAPYTYAWSPSTGLNSINTLSVTATPTTQTVYTCTVTDNCGSSRTSTFTAVINAVPTATISNNGPLCAFNALNFTSSGGSFYNWSGPNGFTSNLQNPSISNATVVASGIYTVTVTNSAGCTATATTTATVNPAPQVLASASPSVICSGASSQLTSTVLNSGPTTFCTPSVSSCTTYASFGNYLSQVSLNGSPNMVNNTGHTSSSTQCITYYSNPIVGTTTTTLTVGNSYTIGFQQAQSDINMVSAWIDFNNDGVFQTGEMIANGVSMGAILNTTVSAPPFTVPSGIFNGTHRMRVILNFSTNPTDPCGVSPTYTWADVEDYDITITGGLSQAATYSWSPSTTLNDATIANPIASNINSTTIYTVAVTQNNCTNTATTTVSVNALNATISSTNTNLCSGGSAVISANVTGGGVPYSYSWSPGGQTTSSITVAPSTTTVYAVYITDNCGTTLTRSLTVNVNPTPVASATPSTRTICTGGNSNIALTSSVTGTNFTWTTSISGSITGASNGTGNSISQTLVNSGSMAGTVTYTITPSTASCSGTPIVVVVTVDAPVVVSASGNPNPVCPGSNSQLNATVASTTQIVYHVNNITQLVNCTNNCGNGPYSACPPASPNFPGFVWTDLGSGAVTNIQIQFGVGVECNTGLTHTTTINGNTSPTFVQTANNCACTFATPPQITLNFVPTGYNIGGVNTFMVGNHTSCFGFQNTTNTTSGGADFATITVTYGVQTTSNFTWSPSTYLNATNIANPLASNVNASQTYIVTATTSDGCTGTTSFTLNTNGGIITPPVGAGGSTGCGSGTASLTATGTGTLRWYDAQTGGNLLGTGSPFTTPVINQNTTFYVESFNGTCSSTRTAVLASIGSPAAAVILTNSSPILCNGSGQSVLSVSSTDQNYSYTWSPSTNLNTSIGATVTATPAATTTYTCNAFDAITGCNNFVTTTISVGSTPIVTSITSSNNTFCQGNSSQFNVTATLAVNPAPTSYCTPTYNNGCGGGGTSFINSFSFNTIANNGTGCSGAFTLWPFSGVTTTTVVPGQTYNISVQSGATAQAFGVWIDYNRDGSFNSSEYVFFSPSSDVITFTGTVTIPTNASPGLTRIRVRSVNAFNNMTSAASCSNLGNGEAEDYIITIASSSIPTYSWSPTVGLNFSTISNPLATPTSSGNISYSVIVSDPAGCTTSGGPINLVVGSNPSGPSVTGGSRCGIGSVSLSASGSGGNLSWIGSALGGSILNTGSNYSPTVSSTTSYYVYEDPGSSSSFVGLSATAPGTTAFASSTGNYQTFNVLSANGIVINTIDILPNAATPIGTPVAITLENSAGTPISTKSFVTTVAGSVQTLNLGFFVPQGTAYRLRPSQNPNLQYHQTGFTNPYTLLGQVSITGWGPPDATTLYVFFYNWNVSTGCFSPRTQVTATVNPAPALTITPSGNTSYCVSGSVGLTANGNGFINYSWSPSTGLNTTVGSNVTANPSVTTTYTVTANDGNGPGACTNIQTITITVNPSPTISVSTSLTSPMCVSQSFTINGIGGSQGIKQIGTTESASSTTVGVYNGGNTSSREQMIFTPAELNAAGIFGPGNITSLAFDVSNKLSTGQYIGFTISMANTSTVPPLTNTFVTTSLTTVFTGNVTTSLGWNTHVFSTPFAWDGFSNVLIQTCFNNTSAIGFDQVYMSPTSNNRFIDITTLGCATGTGLAKSFRPNVRFTGGSVNYAWSPTTNLSFSNIASPSYTPTTPGNYTYIVTVTDPGTNCTSTASTNFTILTIPSAPTTTSGSRCGLGTVNLAASGTPTLRWFDALNGGNLVNTGNSYSPSLTATTTFFVESYNGGCNNGSRVSVTGTVTTPPPIGATVTTTPKCQFANTTVQVSSATQSNFDVYTWSPATGLLSTSGTTVTCNTTAASTYTVTGLNNTTGCQNAATIAVAVTAAPSLTVTAAQNPLCDGSHSDQLTAIGTSIAPPNGYNYSTTAGNALDAMTGATVLLGSGQDDVASAVANIGFTFRFAGANYTQFSISSNGLMPLGSVTNSNLSNTFTGATVYPFIAPVWDDMHTGTNGNVQYKLTGTSPNRKLIVEWNINCFSGEGSTFAFTKTVQVWLFETTNIVKIVYGYNTGIALNSSSIGIAGSSTNYYSVTTSSNTVSTTTANDVNTVWPTYGTAYIFTPIGGGVTYAWNSNPNFSTLTIPNPLATNLNSSSSFVVTVTDGATGCTNSATINVGVGTPPTVSVTPHLSNYCVSNITNINLIASGADSYTWTPLNNISPQTGANVVVNPSSTTRYIVTGFSNSSGCSNKDTALINVGDSVRLRPLATSGQSIYPPTIDGFICSGNADNLKANAYTGKKYDVDSSITFRPIGYFFSPAPIGLSFQRDDQYILKNLNDNAQQTTAPFVFNYFGVNYTQVFINSNGFIKFGNDTVTSVGTGTPQIIPNASAPNNVIALAWANLNPAAGGNVQYYSTVGDAPFRKFVVEYINVPFSSVTGDGGRLTGQIVLYETTNVIELYITSFNPTLTSTYATEGIENATGTAPAYVNDGWNANYWTATNDAIRFTPSGGTFTYSWTPTTGLTPSPASANVTTPNLTSGNSYTVTAVDSFGCSATQTVGVTVNQLPTFTYTTTGDSCNGQSNGTITVTASGSPGYGYIYSKDNGTTYQSSSVFTGLSAGTYQVKVKDTVNQNLLLCTSAATSITITQPAVLSFTFTPSNVLCNGGNSGSITVNSTGGTTPYIYSKTGGNNYQSSNLFGSLATGNYPIMIKDNNLCETIITIVSISQPPALTISTTTRTNVTLCFGNSNGGITVVGASGGTPSYSYSKDNGVTYQSSNIFGSLTAGTYTVKVKDANSCILNVSTSSTTITQPTQVVINPTATSVTNVNPCHGSNNGIIVVAASGGGNPKTYSKDNGAHFQSSNTFTLLTAGTYQLVAKDPSGCLSTTVTKIVSQPDSVTFSYTSTDVVCYGNGDGTITMAGFGGNGGYNYSIDGGNSFQSTGIFTNLGPGTYPMVVEDLNYSQCTSGIVNVTINEPPVLNFTTVITNVTGCIGGSNAIIEIVATGGLGTLHYSIDGGANFFTSNVFVNLFAGTYSIVVKDANNCTRTSIVSVGQPTQTTFTQGIHQDVLGCHGDQTGYFELLGTGGTGFYHYSNDGGNTFGSYNLFFNLSAGGYNCQIIDNNGCLSGIATITITEPSTIVYTTSTQSASCNNVLTGSITVNASGGTGTFRYSDNGGSTYQTSNYFGNLGSGVYSVYVKDAHNCRVNSNVTVTQPNSLIASASGTDLSCNGNHTGTVQVTVSGGTQPYYYQWNNGDNHPNQSGLGSGSYSVTITDANSCTSQSAVTITQPAALTVVAIGADLTCNGNNTGAISLTVTGGVGTYHYNWNSNFYTTQNLSGISAGAYGIIVTDGNGCSTSASVTLTEPDVLMADATPYDLICNGDNSGMVMLSVMGGTQYYNFDWNSGAYNTQDIFNIPGGTYSVIVTDANGCIASASTVVAEPAGITSTSSTTDLLCNEDGSGSASVNVSGGSSPFFYEWNTGDTTPDIYGYSAGNYELVIYDNNGCSTTVDVTINQPDLLVTVADGIDLSCNGNGGGFVNVSVSGGTTGYGYNWTGPNGYTSILQNPSGLAAGIYTVTVTDANSCTSEASFTVNEPDALVASSSLITLISCNGGDAAITVSATGGTGIYIGTGDVTVTVGIYTYTVTDANGCTSETSITVSEPDALVASSSVTTPISCNGGNATITVSAIGGTGMYSGTGDVTVTAGTYTYTITDTNGCTSETSITVTEPDALVALSSVTTPISCNGGNATIAVSAIGGTLAYTGTGDVTVMAGTYTYTIIDANGCTSETSIMVGEPDALVVSSSITTPISCNGGNAIITVIATGGTGILSGVGTHAVSAGAYSLTVTDANGCTSIAVGTVTEPDALVASSSLITPISCNGGNATITVNASGGIGTYTGAGDVTVTAGIYTYTVNDANGCTSETSITVTEPDALVASSSVTTPISCNGGIATITVSAIGGTGVYTGTGDVTVIAGTYTYTITDANGCTSETSITVTESAVLVASSSVTTPISCQGGNAVITVSATGGTGILTGVGAHTISAGAYSFTVTDANGCTSVTNGTADEPATLQASSTAGSILCNGGTTTVTVTATGGTNPYTGTGPHTVSAGVYSFTVTDAHGCTSVIGGTVSQPTVVALTTVGTNLTCNGGGNGTVSVSVTGGVNPYGYSWSNNATTATQSGLSANTYGVTVTDNNGCAATASVTVDQPAVLVATANGTNLTCNGNGSGSVNVSVTGGTTGYGYSWTGPNGYTSTSQNPSGLAAGTYNVTVTDAHGCTSVSNATITQTGVLTATVTGINLTCNGNASGTVSVSVSGGSTPYHYSWNNGATTASQSSLSTGSYSVAVSDANQCTANSNTLTLTQPTTVAISSTTPVNVVCNGASTGAINSIIAAGGTGTITYSKDGGSNYQGGNSFAGLAAGSYAVVAKDANGCLSGTTNVTLTENTAITFTATPTNVSGCFGNANGRITMSGAAGGGGTSYTYSRNNGTSFQGGTLFSGLTAGTYLVRVKNNLNCTTAVSNTIVTQPTQVVITSSVPTNATCNGGATGQIVIAATGGTGAYFYSKNNGVNYGNLNAGTITGLTAATYPMVAKDQNNCSTAVANTIVGQPAAVTFTTTNVNASNCATNSADGSITVAASGGTAGYFYSKNGGTTYGTLNSNVFSGLTAATYNIQVKDINNCTGTVFADALACNNPRLALEGNGTNFGFTVYPNPASTNATVEFSTDGTNAYKLKLSDVLGRTLIAQEGVSVAGDNQRQLDVSSLAKGVYMVTMEIGTRKTTLKLVIQ